MKEVSVIIACYNEEKFVDDCLTSLLKTKEVYPLLNIIVKDQDSTDGTVNLIKEKYPWVKLITGGNNGLSKAFNICRGETQAEYLLFLGMDARVEPNTIPGLVEYFEKNQEVGAATVKLVLANGDLDMDAHRSFPTPRISFFRLIGLSKLFPKSSFFNGYFLPNQNLNEPHEIDLCISHFMFARAELINKIGGFDEDFFLYGEDVDICYRIKETGAKIMYLPQWTATHLKGGSVGIRKTTRDLVKKPLAHRLKMQRLTTQAMELFLKKHYLKKYPKVLVYFMIISSRALGLVRVLLESVK